MLNQILLRYINSLTSKLDEMLMLEDKRSGMSFVAMFHNVVGWTDEIENDEFAITSDNLTNFLDTCKKNGFEIVSIDRLLSMKPADALQKKVVITFDDGFESLHTIVDPLFCRRGIPYTAFITTSFLNKPGYLSESQLVSLSKSDTCTIGMHADQHVMYRYESDDCLKGSYIKCRDRLANITHVVPEHFAFPYGSLFACSMHNCKQVKAFGAKTVFVTRQAKLRNFDLRTRYNIPRLNIPGYYNNTIPEEYRGLNI